jgi:microcystin-dependent protein
MIGAIMAYIGDEPPPGMLALDGAVHDGDDYPKLYAIIPETWKLTGTEFYLPDMADTFVVGAGNLYPVDSTGGEDEHVLTEAEMPSHSHTTQPHDHGYTSPVTSIDTVGELPGVGLTGTIPAVTTSSAVTVDSTGGGQPHTNMPPYRAFRWGIVAQ